MFPAIIERCLQSEEFFNFVIERKCHLESPENFFAEVKDQLKNSPLIKKSFDEFLTELSLESKMSAKYRQVTTHRGLDFDLAKSLLQKYLRRGNQEGAMEIALELDLFRFCEKGQSIVTNFYNRLRIIILEDVGIANPFLILHADKLLDTNNLTELIPLIVRSPKTRFYSHMRAYYFIEKNVANSGSPKNLFPLKNDENLRSIIDNFVWTLENKDISAWFYINQILIKEKVQEKYFNSTRAGFLILRILQWHLALNKESRFNSLLDMCVKWYKNLKAKEQFLLIVHPVYVYILAEKIQFPEIFPGNAPMIRGYLDIFQANPVQVKSYAADMHTRQGRALERNRADFAVEGSLISYEYFVPEVLASKMCDVYNKDKISQGTINFEKEEFVLKVRAQLTCSKSRPDVYFAKNRLQQNVVVKGPLPSYEAAIKTFNIMSLLKLFSHVNTFDVNIKLLFCDQFSLFKVPIGTRTSLDLRQPWYFLEMEDLFDRETYPVKIHKSKLWPETQVLDYEQLFTDGDGKFGYGSPENISDTAKFSLLIQLSIRYVFEIGDFATRNLVRIGDFIYNIDIDNVHVSNSFKLKKSDGKILRQTYLRHKQEYLEILQSWLDNKQAWSLVKSTLQLDPENFRKNVQKLMVNVEFIITGDKSIV